jgi:hypothetical protein
MAHGGERKSQCSSTGSCVKLWGNGNPMCFTGRWKTMENVEDTQN